MFILMAFELESFKLFVKLNGKEDSNPLKKPEQEEKEKEKPRRSRKSKSKFSFEFFKDPRFHLASGFVLLVISVFLFGAFVSYLFTGKADQSVMESASDGSLVATAKEAENWLGMAGAYASHYLVFRWLGISAFFIPPIFRKRHKQLR